MKINLTTYFLSLILILVSCKSNQNLIDNTTFPNFIGNDLDFLGSYKSSSEVKERQYTNHYNSLNLKTIRNERSYEFWIDDLLIYSMSTKVGNECRVIEVFKKNFILISLGSCGIATPDYVDRNNVKVIDLNSRKIYSFSLQEFRLTRSVKMSKVAYPNSKKYFGILNFDLESNKLKIYNQFKGVIEIDLKEILTRSKK